MAQIENSIFGSFVQAEMKRQEVAELQTDGLQSVPFFGPRLELWVKMRQKISRDDYAVEKIRKTVCEELDGFGWQLVCKRNDLVPQVFLTLRLGKRSRNQNSMNRILFRNSASTLCSSSSSPQPRQNPISRSIDIDICVPQKQTEAKQN